MNAIFHSLKLAAAILGVSAILASTTNAATIGYWRFESEPDGTGFGPDFLEDSGPNNLDLSNPTGLAGQSSFPTDFSDPVPLTGEANDYHAFTLNNDQDLVLADNPLLPTNDFTIEAMVRFSPPSVDNGLNADIATQWGGGANNAWRLLKNGANQLSMGLSGNGFGFYVSSGFNFVANIDYYVAAVVDIDAVDTDVTFFIQDLTNGGSLQQFTGNTGAANEPGPLNDSISPFIIGGNAATGDIGAIRIDEVRLSSGLVAEADLLITPGTQIPEPSAFVLLLGASAVALVSNRRC